MRNAIATVEGMGCRVGRIRIVNWPQARREEGTVPGTVWLPARHGDWASLAPRGAAVDLLLAEAPPPAPPAIIRSESPPPRIEPSAVVRYRPELAALYRQYAGPAAPGETRIEGRGPVLPGRQGLVLTRNFIPGSRAAGGLLRGDGRTYMSNGKGSYRAAMLWDTSTGQVVFRVAGSCRKGVRGFVFDPRDSCRSALPLHQVGNDYVFRKSDSRRKTNLVHVAPAAFGGLHVRLSILNSYTNSLPGRLGSFSVDFDLDFVPAATPSGFSLTLNGNGYPAVESEFYPAIPAAPTATIARRDIEHPHVSAAPRPPRPARAPRIPIDGGGGDAAYDGASWARCTTAADGWTMTCRDRHNNHRQWVTAWP